MKKNILFLCCVLFNFASTKIRFSNKESGISFGQNNSKLILQAPILNVNGKITFKDNDPNRVQGSTPLDVITFDQGMTGTSGREFKISGTFDPLSTDLLRLRTNESIEIYGQTVSQTVIIEESCEAGIYGSPIFASPVQMRINSTLNLGISSSLSQPISSISGNILRLKESLKMGLNVPLNTGTLNIFNLNGFEFFCNNALSAVNSYEGIGTVHFLTGSYIVNHNLNFNGTVDVAGQNSSLTFSPGKSISFGAGMHDLFDIELKGLDTTSTFSVNAAGSVFLSGVKLNLDGDVTLAGQGNIVVLGPNCKIIPNGHKLRLANGTRLVVDGVDLFYEPKNPFDASPLELINLGGGLGAIDLLNGGRIIATNYGLSIQDNLTVAGSSTTATSNWQLTSTSKLIFANSTPLVHKNITYNGAGFYIQFPPGTTVADFLEIGSNTKLTFQNVTLKDFNPETILLTDVNSSVEFGQNTQIQLAADQNLATAFKWIFSGNSTLDAAGKTLVLKNANVLQVKNNATLVIANANIKIEHPDAIACLTDASTVCLQNSTITLNKDGLNLASGNTQVKGSVAFFGANENLVQGSATLSFSSKGNFTVEPHSELTFNRGTIFEYKANPANNGSNTAATKRHFILNGPSAKLNLNGCSLISTQTAFAIDFGTIYVTDNVLFTIDPSPGCDAEFGTDLLVEVLAGGCLDINGPLRYITTTFIP